MILMGITIKYYKKIARFFFFLGVAVLIVDVISLNNIVAYYQSDPYHLAAILDVFIKASLFLLPFVGTIAVTLGLLQKDDRKEFFMYGFLLIIEGFLLWLRLYI